MSKRKHFELRDAADVVVRQSMVALDRQDEEDVFAFVDALKTRYSDSLLRYIDPDGVRVFANDSERTTGQPMGTDARIHGFGNTPEHPLIVQLPAVHEIAAVPIVVEQRRPLQLPPMEPLEDVEALRKECLKIATQPPGSVFEIKHIYDFMKPLGGCTKTGRLYWREEERQLWELLRSVPEGATGLPAKRNIVIGSPGVGKSTMLCILAFYVALVERKNVLLVRQLKGSDQRYCYFVLRPKEDGTVEWFSNEYCTLQSAIDRFADMHVRRDFKTVRMLDGFVYENLHDEMHTFHFLATSERVYLKSDEIEHAARFLFPCWHQDDLFVLGRALYGWEDTNVDGTTGNDEGMIQRFYYSGGSVREFTRPSVDEIEARVHKCMENVLDPKTLLLGLHTTRTGKKQCDHMRRTVLDRDDVMNPEAYCWPRFWRKVVDSQYALSLLQKRVEADDDLHRGDQPHRYDDPQ